MRSYIAENNRRKLLLNQSGLFGYWPDARTEGKHQEWKTVVEEIKNQKNSLLLLLGATGWETFGNETSPLHNAISTYNKGIRIMLMDPDSQYLKARAKAVGMNDNDYKNEIIKSINYLKELRKKNHHISLKLYDSLPNWKMIITSKHIHIQYYNNDSHVADCPLYQFYSTDNPGGLYHFHQYVEI